MWTNVVASRFCQATASVVENGALKGLARHQQSRNRSARNIRHLAPPSSRSISSYSGTLPDNNHVRHPPGCGCCHVSRPTTNAPTLSQHRYTSSKSGNDDDDKDEHTATSPEESSLENKDTATMADQLDLGLPGAQKGGKKLAIVFTCTVCNTRSAKQFTEKAYKMGVVMVVCPGCDNKHLIADNLHMFDDEQGGWSIEKAMAKMGQDVTTVTDDNVFELTLDQWVGEEKLQEIAGLSIADDEPKDNGKS